MGIKGRINQLGNSSSVSIYRNGNYMGNIIIQKGISEEDFVDLINHTVLRNYTPPIKDIHGSKNKSWSKKILNLLTKKKK